MSVTPTVACVGAGSWGHNLVRTFADLGALSWVCDLDPGIRSGVGAAFPAVKTTASFDEVLTDRAVSAVVLATPAETHAALTRKALLAGRDVLVEKPLSLSLQEGAELVDLAARTNRVLMVGHLLWYHPAVLKLKALIDEGELGRIQYIYSNRLNLGRIRREENILWSFAPHDISVILGLLGEEPHAIDAFGGNYLREQIADVTVSLLSFPSGVKAHIFVSWLHPYKEQKLIVVGDRQMAVFNDMEARDKLLLYPHTINWNNQLPVPARADAQVIAVETSEPLRQECLHFLECVGTRRTPRTDGREAMRVLKVLDACQRALEVRGVPSARTAELPAPKYSAHSSAFIDEDVEIGEGTTIWHVSHVMKHSRIGRNCRIGQNVVIGPSASIGDGVKIQNNVSIYQGVTLEDDVFCGPSMVFTNVLNPRSEIPRMDELRPTLVRRGATLGANSTIVCGVTIGRYAFVGAGAVVVKDVPDFALVVGNPARLAGWRCVCGARIDFERDHETGACADCGRTFRKGGHVVSLDVESTSAVRSGPV
jgi:UDP-2-acetamido-3-amino-2,3-dideoxy-glucuronate N-acetyltransferase